MSGALKFEVVRRSSSNCYVRDWQVRYPAEK